MLRTPFLLLFATCSLTTVLCSATYAPSKNAVTTPPLINKKSSKNTLDELWDASNRFTGNFMQFKLQETDKSFIASPFSVLIPLGQIAPFTKGLTFTELLQFLNLNDRTEIQGAFRSLLDDLNSPKSVTLLLGQKVYANKQFTLNPQFIEDSKRYFDSEAQNLDFSRNEEAAGIINDWVEKQTKGLITDLVKSESLDEFTKLVLVNAIYFKGNWLQPFDPKSTQKSDFYTTVNETVSVDMMYQEGYFGYTENSQYKALQLYYKDKDFSLLIILPTSSDNYSLRGLLHLFDDSDAIPKIIKELYSESVQVYLPSIETSTTTDLMNILQRYNVTQVFNQKAEMSGLLKTPAPLGISGFIQQAKIIINERGSEAAAANAGIAGVSANIPTTTFKANRPYVYYILNKNNVLFGGAFTGKE